MRSVFSRSFMLVLAFSLVIDLTLPSALISAGPPVSFVSSYLSTSQEQALTGHGLFWRIPELTLRTPAPAIKHAAGITGHQKHGRRDILKIFAWTSLAGGLFA